MPEQIIGVPLGLPDDGPSATSVDSFQLINATLWEHHTRSDGSTTRGGIIRQSSGVETRPDATLRVHEGSAVLDMGPNRVVYVAIPYIPSMDCGLAKGSAGTVIVYVAPPATGSNRARIGTTTSSSLPASHVRLDRLIFPAGWTSTSQARSDIDREHAALQGTTHGQLALKVDSGGGVRVPGTTYRALAASFDVPVDSAVTLHLSSTIRSCVADGSRESTTEGAVAYELWLDGVLVNTWQRNVDSFATTWSWETSRVVLTGTHEIYVVSRHVGTKGGGSFYWQVLAGGANRHLGDALRVKDEGVRR